MGAFSIWHWVLVLVVALLLFGRGKISEVMGDVAKGIKGFKRGLADDAEPEQAARIGSVDAAAPPSVDRQTERHA